MSIAAGVSSKGTTTGASSATTTGVSTSASGSTIYLAARWRDSATFTSISDNKGNTYTQIGTEVDEGTSSGTRFRRYYCENATGGAGHTATINISASTEITLLFLEITGGLTSGILDKSAQADDATSPYASGSTATTAQANELLVGFGGADTGSNPGTHTASGSTPAAGSWTQQVTEDDGSTLWPASLWTAVVTATGAYEWSFTESGATGHGVAIIDTFKETAGGGASVLDTSDIFPGFESQSNPLVISVW